MRKILFGLAAVAVTSAAVFAGEFNKVVSVGDKAPDIKGIPAILDGKDTTLNLSDLKDDIVVVIFHNKGCPYVVGSEDRFIDFSKAYAGKGVKVVAISVNPEGRDSIDAIKNYMKEKGSNYLYGYDASQAVGKAYGATNTPQVFVLDKTRTIRYTGAMDNSPMDESKATKHYLKDAVEALLKGETIEVTETRPVGCGIGYARNK
ncbi:MAG: thioredoxin family protein [Planctomycetota bacterium]|nr:thioredoxin family protein [Planctomycetota bacterium]